MVSETPRPLEWADYLIRPTDQKYPTTQGIPNASGVYAWYSRDGDLLYIGRSLTLNTRLRKHHMPMFGGVLLSYRPVPDEYLAGVEMAHVKTLEPFHNEAREACGLPFWDDLCRAIDAAWADVLPGMRARVIAHDRETNEQIAAGL